MAHKFEEDCGSIITNGTSPNLRSMKVYDNLPLYNEKRSLSAKNKPLVDSPLLQRHVSSSQDSPPVETRPPLKHKRLKEIERRDCSPFIDLKSNSDTLLEASDSSASLLQARTPKVRHSSLGYVDTGAAELGAVPMRGKHKDDWMKIQVSTFTNWINDRLSSSSSKQQQLCDLNTDFEDGLKLIKLLESLTNKKINGVIRNPIFTAQKIANLDLSFAFMKSEGVRLTAIGSQNIYEGNLKLTMGLVWSLIQHYQIMRRNTKVSTKELMLNWIQSLMPYWDITNFTSNWRDGRVLLSLIREIRPDKVPSLSSIDRRKGLSNCTLAIRTAKIHLKVPPIISPEDLVSGELDDLSMMTYLSYFVKPASKAVLRWVHEMIPQIKVNNLTTDWNNGIALAALLNARFPGLFPKWKSLSHSKPENNIERVFKVAQDNCGIVPHLSPSEMADPTIEELHIMTYILCIKNSSLLSLPDNIDISGPGINEAKLGHETYFVIDTTKAGAGDVSVKASYQDSTAIKFSLTEKRPGILKLVYIPQKTGKLEFNIYWSDTPIPGSPFHIHVIDTSLIKIVDRENLQTMVHVHSKIQVQIDATAVSNGSLTVRLMYPDCPPVSPEVTHDNGIYTIDFEPVTIGTPTLRFYWEKEELIECAIEYTVVDTRRYQISQLPDKHLFYTFEPINFTVQSSNGLPLDLLKLTAICEDMYIPFDFGNISESNSKGEADFIPTLPGRYCIEVSCMDRLVEGSPFYVTVVDPSKCILMSKPPKYLAINNEFEFTINIKEAGHGKIRFKCLDNPEAFESVIVNNIEIVSIKVTPKTLGDYMVAFYHSDREIPGCPIRLIVCDPSLCNISGTILQTRKAIVGQPVSFSLSNPNWMDIKPAVKVQGPTAHYPVTIEKKSSEELAVKFTPWEVGQHLVSVTFGGYQIPHTPCEFITEASETSTCSASGTGLQYALTGIPAQFLLHARSGLLDAGHLDISVQNMVSGNDGRVRIRDNNNSSYNVAYLVYTPGAYLVNIKAWNKHIPGSPFKVNVKQGPEAKECILSGDALKSNTILKIGDPIEFSVDARNGGSGKLNVDAVGPRGVQARVFIAAGEKSGIHDILLDPIRPGKYRVSVKWSGQHVPGSPFIVRVFPGADASKCRAYGPGLQDGVVGKPSSFTIETKDAGSGVLKVRLNGIKDAFKVEVRPKSPQDVRTLLANYNPNKPGDYLITIKWSEKDIPGSPFKVNISGQLPTDRSYNGMLYATPQIMELDTIAEEYEELESSNEDKDRSFKKYHNENNNVTSIPPTFGNMGPRKISYRNNFATTKDQKRKKGGQLSTTSYRGRANVKINKNKQHKSYKN